MQHYPRRFKPPITSNERLLSIMAAVLEGRIVLPEFQRSFLWTRDQIEELILSVLACVHIGNFLMLDMLRDDALIPFRLMEGLKAVNPTVDPNRHTVVREVLDGQQRITSLFYVLYEPDIPLRGATYPHRFFLRLDRLLSDDLDEAVIGVSQRNPKLVSEMNKLMADGLALPMTTLRNSATFNSWLYTQQGRWRGEEQERLAFMFDNFTQYSVPVNMLAVETEVDTIVSTFERLNRMVTNLSVFDLIVAIQYRKGIQLREMWNAFAQKYPDTAETIKPESLLKIITLLEGREARRTFMLSTIASMPREVFVARWAEAIQAVVEAMNRIAKEYGAIKPRWIPYTTLIVPLAAILHKLRKRRKGAQAYRVVDHWYWLSVFTQRYDHSADTQSSVDLKALDAHLDDATVELLWPTQLRAEDLDLDVSDGKSAIYRGLLCLTVLAGAHDFLTGQPAHLHECEDDHIFAEKRYRNDYPVNLIFNRTLLNATTNKWKNARTPSEVLALCLAEHDRDEGRLLETLSTHFISAEGYAALLAEDFETFIATRRALFIQAINERLAGQPQSSILPEGVTSDD